MFGAVAMPVTLPLSPGSCGAPSLVWGVPGIKHLRPPRGDQSHRPALTTLPPLHPHMFVVVCTQVPMQTSLPTATNAVKFAKRATSAAFFKHQQNQLLALPAAVAGEKGKTKQLFKEELGIASPHKVPFLISRRKFHLAKSDYDHAMPPALHQP